LVSTATIKLPSAPSQPAHVHSKASTGFARGLRIAHSADDEEKRSGLDSTQASAEISAAGNGNGRNNRSNSSRARQEVVSRHVAEQGKGLLDDVAAEENAGQEVGLRLQSPGEGIILLGDSLDEMICRSSSKVSSPALFTP